MAMTTFTVNHALAVKRWSMRLDAEAEIEQYFYKFIGAGENAMIVTQTELQKAAGDRITVGLQMKLSGDGVEGDNVIEGTSAEEAIQTYGQNITIDLRRKGTKSKGTMSEQRVPYNIRLMGMNALKVWYAEDTDQEIMFMIAGMRGAATSGIHFGTNWTGRASNSFNTPDTNHVLYGGNATSQATIDSADKMSVELVERCVVQAKTVDPMIQPIRVDGEDHFVLLMHTYQAYDLRRSVSERDWNAIHRAVGVRGNENLLFKGGLGIFNGVVLHEHRNVPIASTWGADSAQAGARALFLGAQAGMIAYGGGTGKSRYTWNEETDDRGNALVITAGNIHGCQGSYYNSAWFGRFACDTYAANPNA